MTDWAAEAAEAKRRERAEEQARRAASTIRLDKTNLQELFDPMVDELFQECERAVDVYRRATGDEIIVTRKSSGDIRVSKRTYRSGDLAVRADRIERVVLCLATFVAYQGGTSRAEQLFYGIEVSPDGSHLVFRDRDETLTTASELMQVVLERFFSHL